MNTKLVLIRNSSAMNAGSGTINIVGKRNEFSQKLDYCRPEILFVSSYPPRECGIATYSQDLVNALNMQFYDSFDCSICALESNSEEHVYKEQPSYILNTDSRNSFIKVAFNINRNVNIKLVVIQHEFGFFASKENDFKDFCESIAPPLVFVFHTVLPNPGEDLIRKVGDMANTAAMIIVMTKDAANILIKDYNIPSTSIRVIPHGTHLVPPIEREKMKVQFHFSDRKVLSTFGLLSSSKSIETTLDALPDVISKHPDVLFLILGKTHPTVVKNEGEKYRNLLIEKVNTLALSKHVLFINEYLPLQVLLGYLQLSDIYLFTSKDPHQAVSGTFSYAMSCGCPVISTPIPQAKELLNNNGIIIDFGNSQQLAKAINKLLEDKQLREQISYNNFQTMASTVWQNSAIAHALLFQELTNNAFQLNYRLPAINLAHVKKLTTDIGIIQFSKISTPDLATGFTLDDNARAMIAMCMHFEQMQDIEDLKYIRIYLQFIHHCLQKDGSLLNYVNESSEFTQQNFVENLEDSTGRAVWALGYLIHLKAILPIEFSVQAEIILECLMPYLIKIHSTRAMAFIIKGLHLQNSSDNLSLLKIFANRLVQMYKHERSIDWFWFENYFTYGNSLLS